MVVVRVVAVLVVLVLVVVVVVIVVVVVVVVPVVAIFLLGFVWVIDALLYVQRVIPMWFFKLRCVVSSIVLVALIAALITARYRLNAL